MSDFLFGKVEEVERIGELARGVLADCERAMKANGKKVPGHLERREEFEPEASSRGRSDAQAAGIRARGRDASGLEIEAGEVVRSSLELAPMRSPATNADSYRYDFTSAGPGAFQQGDGDARWIGKRRNAAGARLDGAGSSSLRPAVLIAANCNKRAHQLPLALQTNVAAT